MYFCPFLSNLAFSEKITLVPSCPICHADLQSVAIRMTAFL